MTISHPASTVSVATRRSTLIEAIAEAVRARDAVAGDLNLAGDENRESLARKFNGVQNELMALFYDYEDSLANVALSRCPFTGDLMHYRMDTEGLDGPWWNNEVPARPPEETGDTVFAVTGSVRLPEDPPHLPFRCKPGPAVPYVVPRLLVHSEIKAVVSTIKIGELAAYPVVYFSEDPPHDIARINTWGLDHYVAEKPGGEGYSVAIPDFPVDFEPSLEFYIESGRLLWIAPGDETMTLRSTVADCPYVGMTGRQYPVGLEAGKIWNSLIDRDIDLFEPLTD